MSVTAQKLNRSVEVIRQRIHHHHKDLRGRSGAVQRFLNRYGLELLSLAATPEEAMKVFYRKQLEARASAKERANKAKEAHYATQIRLMLEQINAGQPRNYAIFETRATGVSLQRIGDCFGVTRERIRQICEKVAVEVALGKSISEPKEDLPAPYYPGSTDGDS
jgi:DNA-directed RNA polymerase sigma subunit (sigma70/sigma32)